MSSIELWPKQREALEFALSRDETALLCEQRTGKTYITLALIRELMGDGNFSGLIVGLLNNKETTWKDKLTELLPDLSVFTELTEYRAHKGDKLLLIHYELFVKLIDKLVKCKFVNFMAVDEAHRLSNRSSKQSRAASRMSWVSRKLILTGTPIESQPSDMFAQFRFLAPHVLGTRWDDFEKTYMDFERIDMSQYKYGTQAWERMMLKQRILRSKAEFRDDRKPEFVQLINPYCFRLTADEVGIQGPKVSKVVVPMFGHQLRCYRELENTGVTTTPSGVEIVSGMAVTTLMKIRQIASGFVYDEDHEVEHLGRAKEARLYELFEKLSKPIVVFTAFKPDTDRIHRGLARRGFEVAKVYGATKKQARPGIWRDFQAGKYDGIVCQIKTGGVGVDLWKANNAIVHSMGHSYIDWDQAKARLNARHKNKAPSIYVLCGKGTVDEDLFELVFIKHCKGKAVLDQLKKRRRL